MGRMTTGDEGQDHGKRFFEMLVDAKEHGAISLNIDGELSTDFACQQE